ncbi:MAG: hypothetical protein AAFQ82_03240 [Myxococcota bacterium]
MKNISLERQMGNDAKEALVNELYDLQHDLAKYIRMPLTFLPSHATDSELRDAMRRALRETYRRGDEVVPAHRLWREFVHETPASIRRLESFSTLERAVTRALAWEHSIDQHDQPIDRSSVLTDFAAITASIDLLIVDVEAEGGEP